MGQRSTSSTKSGKFMNPTDQARKEARKRELKKNRKHRMMVRAAALKMKDPKQIIQDMETLDAMEFNPVQQPPLNENVLKDKRKRLRETFERVLQHQQKENPDVYKELRKLEVEYEQKRTQLIKYFDAVKNAQHVDLESIPLPDMPHAPSNILIQHIPLPGAQPPSILKKASAYGPPTPAVPILPLLGRGVPRLPPGRKPPGPPPGPPPPQVLLMYGHKVGFALDLPPQRQDEDMLYSPELAQRGHDDDISSTSGDDGYPEDMEQGKHDDRTEDSDTDRLDSESQHNETEGNNTEEKRSGLRVRFADMPGRSRKKKNMKELTPLQAMMLRMAGQEIPEEGQGVEEFSEEQDDKDSNDSEVEKQLRKQHKEDSHSDGTTAASSQHQAPPQSIPPQTQAPPMPGPPPLRPPGPPPSAAPFLRPPGMPRIRGPPSGRPPGLPQGPPLGLHPQLPPQGPPPRLPPPAPPGILPQSCMMCTSLLPPLEPAPPALYPPGLLPNTGVVSDPPSLIQRPKAEGASGVTMEKKATVTISAKPRITNPKADVTRFVPTALRVRRENKYATAVFQRRLEDDSAVPIAKAAPRWGPSVPVSAQTEDDVYEAFMKEMEGLL